MITEYLFPKFMNVAIDSANLEFFGDFANMHMAKGEVEPLHSNGVNDIDL